MYKLTIPSGGNLPDREGQLHPQTRFRGVPADGRRESGRRGFWLLLLKKPEGNPPANPTDTNEKNRLSKP
nr:MAG TPA: hypothetical protein [Caudoviricetes sp.]